MLRRYQAYHEGDAITHKTRMNAIHVSSFPNSSLAARLAADIAGRRCIRDDMDCTYSKGCSWLAGVGGVEVDWSEQISEEDELVLDTGEIGGCFEYAVEGMGDSGLMHRESQEGHFLLDLSQSAR